MAIIDTVTNVKALVKKVTKLRNKATGEIRGYWSAFLCECRNFIKAETKRLKAKYEALRFAADGQAENIHTLLKADDKATRDFAKTFLFKNKFALDGYLAYCKKYQKNIPNNEHCRVGDYSGSAFRDVADIAKIVRMYAKRFLTGKYSVTVDRYSMGQSIDIRFKGNSKNWNEGKKLLAFLEQFNTSYRYDLYDRPSYRFYTGLQ